MSEVWDELSAEQTAGRGSEQRTEDKGAPEVILITDAPRKQPSDLRKLIEQVVKQMEDEQKAKQEKRAKSAGRKRRRGNGMPQTEREDDEGDGLPRRSVLEKVFAEKSSYALISANVDRKPGVLLRETMLALIGEPENVILNSKTGLYVFTAPDGRRWEFDTIRPLTGSGNMYFAMISDDPAEPPRYGLVQTVDGKKTCVPIEDRLEKQLLSRQLLSGPAEPPRAARLP